MFGRSSRIADVLTRLMKAVDVAPAVNGQNEISTLFKYLAHRPRVLFCACAGTLAKEGPSLQRPMRRARAAERGAGRAKGAAPRSPQSRREGYRLQLTRFLQENRNLQVCRIIPRFGELRTIIVDYGFRAIDVLVFRGVGSLRGGWHPLLVRTVAQKPAT